MLKLRTKGSFKNTERFFRKARKINPKFRHIMAKYGDKGVRALREATPKDSGNTSAQWRYSVENWGLAFYNDNVVQGAPVAILLQYGHATKSGGWVQGIDYINPALRPIFDRISDELKKEVRNL